jgi:hypothetical protein
MERLLPSCCMVYGADKENIIFVYLLGWIVFYICRTQPQTFTYLLIYLLTYLLTPCSRVLLEKLTGLQLVKKFQAFYGTRSSITAFKSARHLSLS